MNQLPLTDDIIQQYVRLAEAGPRDRQRLLSELPPGPLRETICALLEAGDSPEAESLDHPFLELDRALGALHDVDLPEQTPPELGPRYTILGSLGHGGHGDVYLARQERPVQRLVAIKTLRSADAGAAAVGRMRREARALAALHHPGIATVFDAGRAADGRPYLVTEYVDGPPIDTFCAQRSLDFRQRCEIVASLCDAVEHAHQRGIIHRDLKPTNILVAGDERPAAKIVDLGIARIIDPDSREGPTLTHAGALLGTVGYMAPEQLRGEPADTRSDLFALGRVLESLLKGVEPPPRFRRDCAAIVRRATAELPRDRYQSAGAFGADLRAMLADEPVAARRHTLREMPGRLVRRHPASAILVLMLMITLITGGIVLAQKSADATRASAAQKELLTSTLDGIVVVLGQMIGTNQQRAEQAAHLDAQLKELLAVTPNDPELHVLRARVLTERARISYLDGDPREALAREAVEIMERYIDPLTADVDDVRHFCLSMAMWGDTLWTIGRKEESYARFQHVLAVDQAARLRFPGHIGILDDLCWSYDRLSQPPDDATADRDTLLAYAETRLDLSEALLAIDADRVLSQYNMAMAYYRLGQYHDGHDDAEALAWYERALAGLRDLVGRFPMRWAFVNKFARAGSRAARCYLEFDRVDDAIVALEEAVRAALDAVIWAGGADPRMRRNVTVQGRRLLALYEATGDHQSALALQDIIEAVEQEQVVPGRPPMPWRGESRGPLVPSGWSDPVPLTPRSAPAP